MIINMPCRHQLRLAVANPKISTLRIEDFNSLYLPNLHVPAHRCAGQPQGKYLIKALFWYFTEKEAPLALLPSICGRNVRQPCTVKSKLLYTLCTDF